MRSLAVAIPRVDRRTTGAWRPRAGTRSIGRSRGRASWAPPSRGRWRTVRSTTSTRPPRRSRRPSASSSSSRHASLARYQHRRPALAHAPNAPSFLSHPSPGGRPPVHARRAAGARAHSRLELAAPPPQDLGRPTTAPAHGRCAPPLLTSHGMFTASGGRPTPGPAPQSGLFSGPVTKSPIGLEPFVRETVRHGAPPEVVGASAAPAARGAARAPSR